MGEQEERGQVADGKKTPRTWRSACPLVGPPASESRDYWNSEAGTEQNYGEAQSLSARSPFGYTDTVHVEYQYQAETENS